VKQQNNRRDTRETIAGYAEWVRQHREEGLDTFILTLTFNHIPGPRHEVLRRMINEVERVYYKSLTRIVNNPSAPSMIDKRPIWIVTPDLPVPKKKQSGIRELKINGGLHLHAIVLMPRKSKIKCKLDQHFEEEQFLYVRPNYPLSKVHARLIRDRSEYVTEYVLKSLERGRTDLDEVVIFPRSRTEPHGKSKQASWAKNIGVYS
jgi:hypothetical protein